MTPPATPAQWEALRTKTVAELRKLGLARWEECNRLMLIPVSWYDKIPDGFELTTINGRVLRFQPGITNADRRYGFLAYGVHARASRRVL